MHHVAFSARTHQFGVGGGLEGRVTCINLTFTVNPKQQRNGDIRFLNGELHQHLNPPGEHVRHRPLDFEVAYEIRPQYFSDGRDWFQSVLVTAVRTTLREEHKKIKVRVSAEPTAQFLEQFKNRLSAEAETKIDLNLRKSIELNRQIRLILDSEPEDIRRPTVPDRDADNNSNSRITIQTNYGPVVNHSARSEVRSVIRFPNEPAQLTRLLDEMKALRSSLAASPSPESAKQMAALDVAITETPKNSKALEKVLNFGKGLAERVEKLGLTILGGLIKDYLSTQVDMP